MFGRIYYIPIFENYFYEGKGALAIQTPPWINPYTLFMCLNIWVVGVVYIVFKYLVCGTYSRGQNKVPVLLS